MQQNKINLITSDSKFEGTIEFSDFTRFEGYLTGILKGKPKSELIVGQDGVVEGNIYGHTVIIDGFVRGEIQATSRVVITSSGRVIGKITAPRVAIQFGAYFDGQCSQGSLEPRL